MHPLQLTLAAGASGAEIIIVLAVLLFGWISSAVEKLKKARAAQPIVPPPSTPEQLQNRQRQFAAVAKTQLANTTQQPVAKRAKPGKRAAIKNIMVAAPAAIRAAAAVPAPAATPPAFQPVSPAIRRTLSATAVHAWLTPATLRKQFLLTEILNPPLALREQR